jgi:glycosyltransferase involved in cell wall biosynthesis
MTLSVVVLTRNEAENIERCLKSVQWADEILVVDAESTDGTPEIAERLGACVIVHPWEGAGAQYAFGIAQARSDWVLILDADEEVTAELADAIRKAIADPQNPFAGYKVRRVNYVLGRWLRYGGWQEWVLRLFLRERVTSPPTLHPRFQVDGKVGVLPYPIRHYMAPDLWAWWERSFRLARIEADAEFLQGERFSGWAVVGGFWKFLRRFLFKGGFLDGWAGFYACLHRFLYIAIKQARLLELQRGATSSVAEPQKLPFR